MTTVETIKNPEQVIEQLYVDKKLTGIQQNYTPIIVRDYIKPHVKNTDKLLIIYNLEFVKDYYQTNEIVFISDDVVRNKIAEIKYKVKTILIKSDFSDFSEIKKTLIDMKFDLIISNPPYNNNLDLKILKSIYNLSERICLVHPATWILDKKGICKQYNTLKESIKNSLKSIVLFNGNSAFNIYLLTPCMVTYIDMSHNNENINVLDKLNNKNYNISNIYDIDLYSWYENYTTLRNKILNYCKNDNLSNYTNKKSGKFYINFPVLRGHIDNIPTMFNDDFYTFFPKDLIKYEVITDNNQSDKNYYITLDTNNKRDNCIKYLKDYKSRFCLSLFKKNRNLNRGEFESVPYFDFTNEITDDFFKSELGITDEELSFMRKSIPDYYES